MKKYLIIGLAVIVLTVTAFIISKENEDKGTELLSGSLYRVMEYQDGFYLKFHDETELIHNTFQGDLTKNYNIPFSSFQQMQETIISQTYDAAQLYTLKKFITPSIKGMPIYNLRYQYVPVLPDSLKTTDVLWYGIRYGYNMVSNRNEPITGSFNFYSPYDSDYIRQYNDDYPLNLAAGETLESTAEDPTREATIAFVQAEGIRKKIIHYAIQVGDKKLEVREDYLLNDTRTYAPVSASVPQHILIFGSEGNFRYVIRMENFIDRPSLEWIRDFGFQVVPTQTNF